MQITKNSQIPQRLKQLVDPPQQLHLAGSDLTALLDRPCLAVVGSRAVTPYGQQVTEQLVTAAACAGIVIISGLAFGVDSLAHRAALDVSGLTIAVLPTNLQRIYPASHQQLARQIAEQGGALVSEYDDSGPALKYRFIARNRLIAGLADAVLITEASTKSGSLHTAHFAHQQGRPVLAVPGNINNANSKGTNQLIKQGVARAITEPQDILKHFGILAFARSARTPTSDNPAEQAILDLIEKGVSRGQELLAGSRLSVAAYQQTMTMLEINGQIRPLGADNWAFAFDGLVV